MAFGAYQDDDYEDESPDYAEKYRERVNRTLDGPDEPAGDMPAPFEAAPPVEAPVGPDRGPLPDVSGTGIVPPAMPAQAGGYDRQRFRDAWQGMGSGAKTRADMEAFLANNPAFSQGVSIRGEDQFVLPDPRGDEVIDALFDERGPGAYASWTGTGYDAQGVPDEAPAQAPPPQAAPQAPNVPQEASQAAPYVPPTEAPQAAPTPSFGQLGTLIERLNEQGASSDFQKQLRQMLLERMTKLNAAGDPNSLQEVRQPMSAAERTAERVRQRRQDAAAERLTAEGVGDSGALDSEISRGYEDMSSDLSGLNAELVSRIMVERRQEAERLLAMAMESGDAESARQLQKDIAVIDAELQRSGLEQRGQQFNADLGYRYAGLNQQGRQFDQDLGYRYAGLGQQGRQFDQDLGYRYANMGQQQSQFNDQFGRQLGRDYEDDYMKRILLGLGG